MSRMARGVALLLAAVFTLGAAGCGAASSAQSGSAPASLSASQSAASRPGPGPAATQAELLRGLISPRDDGQDAAAQQAATGANAFAFRLAAALQAEAKGENFVCSPYSVWLPLAALLNATDEAHRPALLQALGAAGLDADAVNRAASRMLYDLNKLDDAEWAGDDWHDPLRIANAVFVDNDVTLSPAFTAAFAAYYLGRADTVDFSDASAVEAVNAWAAEHTEGLIDQIIDEFDPATVAAVVNAIYFQDRWEWEFDPEETREDVFYSAGGADVQAHYMLREGDALGYYEDEAVQAMPLRFKTGGALAVLLPRDGDAAGLLAQLDEVYFERIMSGTQPATGRLLLPRFSIDSGVMDLADTLTALGVPLFDAEAAPLTGGLIEQDVPVYLSDAVQKAVIEVDEKGTTAAAVTVMGAAGSGMPEPTEPFDMNCNRPFVFVLYDHTYDGGNQVLFVGVVGSPA